MPEKYPFPSGSSGTVLAPSSKTTSTLCRFGAHTRNRTPPSRTSAPKAGSGSMSGFRERRTLLPFAIIDSDLLHLLSRVPRSTVVFLCRRHLRAVATWIDGEFRRFDGERRAIRRIFGLDTVADL